MNSKTIDFADIQTDVCEDILNLKWDYHLDREVRSRLFSIYREQKSISDNIFSDWLAQTNAGLIKDVDNFIKRSLGIDGNKNLFKDYHSDLIHPATVILGLQASDHRPTIDMIEQHVEDKYCKIKTLRVPPGLTKKSQILEIFASTYKSRKILVVVEQTETMDKYLLESLISGSWKTINNLFPISIMNRMKKNTTIVKETTNLLHDMKSRLLKNKDLIFKLDPHLMGVLIDSYILRDASIMHIQYLYQYALFIHHTNIASLLSSGAKYLNDLLQTQPKLFDDLKNLPSLSVQKEKILHLNQKSFVKFCVEQTEYIQNYHRFISSQLDYYLILLHDETQSSFPCGIEDLYVVLFEYEDLGNSSAFVDAISKLSKYSLDGLKRRLEKVRISRVETLPYTMEKVEDVYDILIKYLEKLENNDDCKLIVQKLINELLKHSQSLKNPLGPLNESIYHSQSRKVQARAQPATIYHAMKEYVDDTTHFGSLYKLIHVSPEEMNIYMLFGDFVDSFKSLRRKRISTCGNSPTKVRKNGQRKTKSLAKLGNEETNPPEEDEGLLKAIFVDIIDCMEFQGLVKQDKKCSRRDILKKCVWL